MLIIRTEARLFEHILDLIKEQENKGFKYLRDEDDGTAGKIGICLVCCKRVYFDDKQEIVSYEDRTKYLNNL